MGRVEKGAWDVAQYTAIGAGIGFMAGSTLRVAGISACIAAVKQVTSYVFDQALKNTRFEFLWKHSTEIKSEKVIISAIKLVVDVTLGTLVAFGLSAAFMASQWTVVPVINLVALGLLLDYGKTLINAIGYFVRREVKPTPMEQLTDGVRNIASG